MKHIYATQFLSLFLVTLLVISNAFASGPNSVPPLPWKGKINTVRDQYLNVLSDFRDKTCTSQVRDQFSELYKLYKHEGYYIPLINGNELDEAAIRQGLPLIEEKLQWIASLKANLEKAKSLPSVGRLKKQVEVKVEELLELKKKYYLTDSQKIRQQVSQTSSQKMKELKTLFNKLTREVPFLLTFKHPVNHFKNRLQYEQAAERADHSLEHEKRKNSLYFQRKVYEDGTTNKRGLNADIYVRTTLDTVALSLENGGPFLDEDTRYDLEWVLGRMDHFLRKGRQAYIQRLERWHEGTDKTLAYYKNLIERQPANDGSSVAQEKAEASARLKEFVLKQQAKTYAYFSKQPELIQALFALDEILLNEVGRANNYNYRDRKDVAQIVINRRHHPEYSKFSDSHPLRPYLKQEGVTGKQITQSRWLNVLFKYGEFSFTLYFIPAVKYTFCPDTYHVARSTRKKNVALGLYQLKNPNTSFKALRYFSRFSMIGKISMDDMWKDYQPVPERPGRKRRNTARLEKALKDNKYRYLYNFKDRHGTEFHVLEIGDSTFAVSGFPRRPEFYNHRDRHKFTYFQPKGS